jgi:hypothetical protein
VRIDDFCAIAPGILPPSFLPMGEAMLEPSSPLHVRPNTSRIRYCRRPEVRNGRRDLTRIDPSSICKPGTYAYYIREREITTWPHTGHRRHQKLWRQYHLTYDQPHYVAKEVRRALAIERPKTRTGVVAQLSREEERQLMACAYRVQGTRGLLIKTLVQRRGKRAH